jgi:predicted DNA-binding transcriptional regulator AlpA
MNSINERHGFAARGALDGQTTPCELTTPRGPIANIEPVVTKADLERILQIDSRTIDRMRSSGRLPKPDLVLSRMPRWRPQTIRQWIESGGGK